jgi:hypothetical protein
MLLRTGLRVKSNRPAAHQFRWVLSVFAKRAKPLQTLENFRSFSRAWRKLSIFTPARKPDPMDDEASKAMREKIADLRMEHRDLDEAILRLAEDVCPDHLRLTRLKKRKLMLKDTIARLESRLIPDLDA